MSTGSYLHGPRLLDANEHTTLGLFNYFTVMCSSYSLITVLNGRQVLVCRSYVFFTVKRSLANTIDKAAKERWVITTYIIPIRHIVPTHPPRTSNVKRKA